MEKIEKEYKMLLTKYQFELLINNIKGLNKRAQINYYYQVKPQSNKLMVRIRQINNQYFFTLKYQSDQLYEYEFEISHHSLDDERINSLFDKFKIDEAVYIGSMKTIRYYKDDQYGELCLDHNLYHEMEDYEFEYELYDSNQNHSQYVNELLLKYDIKFNNNSHSKFKRFLTSVK